MTRDSKGSVGERRSVVRYLLSEYPSRMAKVIALLTVSGLAEGVGFVSVLPLLGALSETSGTTPFEKTFTDIIDTVGLPPTIGGLLLLIAVGLWIKGILFLLAMRQAGFLGSDLSTELRLGLIEAMGKARWGYVIRQPVGSLTNSISTEAARAGNVARQFCQYAARLIQVVLYVLVAVLISWQATAVAVGFAAILGYLLKFLTNRARHAGTEETKLLNSLTRRLADGLASLKGVRAMGRDSSLRSILVDETVELDQQQKKQAFAQAALPAVQEPMVATGLAVALFFGVQVYNVPFDQLLFFALLFYRVVNRSNTAQQLHQIMVIQEAAFWSIIDLIRDAEQAEESRGGSEKVVLSESIDFDGVSFSYEDEEILADFHAHLDAGEFLLVTGPSGVGKTTFVDLLSALLDPTRGEILIDGVPLRTLDRYHWRRQIGYVPQDSVLLHESVAVNISLNEEGIGRHDIETSLRAANAWSFVSELPEGMDTSIGERGLRLSGGQRQRLGIARALVHRPRLLILDEATTGLDPVSEGEVLNAIKNLKGSVTIVAVSHQGSIRPLADRVIALERRSQPVARA